MIQAATEKKQSKKKNTFTLKGVNAVDVDKKYGIVLPSTAESSKQVMPVNTTKIDELYINNRKPCFSSFLDDGHKYYITMMDSITRKSIQSECCFWCRHSFSSTPIGCPIKYVNNKVIQVHTSEITREKYSVQQQITRNAVISDNDTRKLVENDYYETDGAFCSFNCCMAFINSNINNPLYVNSKHLIMKMYIEIFGSIPGKIIPAPSWRLLKAYGGFMDISEFRNSFTHYIYEDRGQHITKIPQIIPVGHVFEEHIIF
jgi:hypothetical protein